MLQELSVVEQRYLAVREVLDGAQVTGVSTRYGVDRRTVHRWLLRYANEGLEALADRSSRPDRRPHQTPPEIEARVVALRRAHPGWGPRTIVAKLRKDVGEPPSRSSIYRCLVRHRLIDPKPRRRRPQDYKRWERSRPMQLWQVDVMGGVILADGTELKAITGIDDHSRFCVMAKLVPRATARPVCQAVVEALSRHGLPEQILTDNGKVFTGKLAQKPATVAFDRAVPRERHPPHPHRPLLAHHHRQDRAATQDHAQGAPVGGHVRLHRAGPDRARCLGQELQRATGTPGHRRRPPDPTLRARGPGGRRGHRSGRPDGR
jgi:transposase